MIIRKYILCAFVSLFFVGVNGCRTPASPDGNVHAQGAADELIARRDQVLDKELAKARRSNTTGEKPAGDNMEKAHATSENGKAPTARPCVEKRSWYSFLWPFGRKSSDKPAVKASEPTKHAVVAVKSETSEGAAPKKNATVTKEPSPRKKKWWSWGSSKADSTVKAIEKPVKEKVEKKDKQAENAFASKETPEKVTIGHIFERDARGSFYRRRDSEGKEWRWFGWFRKEQTDSEGSSEEMARKPDVVKAEPGKEDIVLHAPARKVAAPKIPEIPREPVGVSAGISVVTNQVDDIRSGMVAKEPLLKPGFMLKINVLASGRKEVDEPEKRVSPSGTIALPLVGELNVDGMTIRQLANKLKDLYSVYLREPMIDVDFVLKTDTTGSVSPWGYVTVLGRVKKPGRINIPPTRDLALSMAIQLAEGLDSSAKLTGIKITREIAGKVEQFEVNLQSVGDKGELDSDIKLRPGDVVYVPERVF